MYLLLHELGHILFYSLLIILFAAASKKAITRFNYLLGLFITLFIDIDHLLDYVLYKGLTIEFFSLTSGNYFFYNQKVIVLLHSWEAALIVLFAGLFIKTNKIKMTFLAVFYGLFAHLVYDVLYYSFDPQVYFFLFRIMNKFDISLFN